VPEQNSPQVNVVCAISQLKTNGPCFFKEKLINGNIYLDMLIKWIKSQLYEDSTSSRTLYLPDFISKYKNIYIMHQHSLMVPKTMASDDPGPSGQKPNIV
jgi:hypothetical protein